MNLKIFFCTAMLALMGSLSPLLRAQSQAAPRSAPLTMVPADYQAREGFVDAHGVLIY
jgi:hypothetical protein